MPASPLEAAALAIAVAARVAPLLATLAPVGAKGGER